MTRRRKTSAANKPAQIYDVLTTSSVFGSLLQHDASTLSREQALRIAFLWQGVQIIASDVSGLTVKMFRRDGRRRDELEDARADLLNLDAASYISARQMRDMLTRHAILDGNGIAIIERVGVRAVALHPVLPSQVYLRTDSEQISYQIILPNGQTLVVPDSDVIHVRGPTHDGLIGEGVLHHAGLSLGSIYRTLRFRDAYMVNSARPGTVLTTARQLSKEQIAQLRATWDEVHRGPDAGFRTAVLPPGLDIKVIERQSVDEIFRNAVDTARQEVAAWLNIPPEKLGAPIARGPVEISQRHYLVHTLRPWLERWEDELNRKLLSTAERRRTWFEHDTEELLRADTETRYRAYSFGIRDRWLSPNEVRERENLPPYPGGDTFENPNTSSQPSGPNSSNDDARRIARAYLAQVFYRLATWEKHKVEDACRKQMPLAQLAQIWQSLPWQGEVTDALRACHDVLVRARHTERIRDEYVSRRMEQLSQCQNYDDIMRILWHASAEQFVDYLLGY